jgi:uncharacterized membrane protein SpoIIM required for sporulation
MRVVESLSRREADWRELDELVNRLDSRRFGRGRKSDRGRADRNRPATTGPDRRPTRPRGPFEGTPSEAVIRLGELYRSACSDLMLAEAYDLPRDTVAYLHDLVARAHNVLYRSRGFRFTQWAGAIFRDVPRRLRSDPMLWLSALLFYGTFLMFGLLAVAGAPVIDEVLSESERRGLEEMYEGSFDSPKDRNDSLMTGFYIHHNASIGLQCYVWGLAFGLGTVYVLVSNGMILGASFGFMALSPNASHFFQFVTAHGPFELTAIVFAGAAGLRLGRSLIVTRGYRRLVSLQLEAAATLPTVGASVFLFVLAAFLEGFVSATRLPYAVKASIAVASALLLILYLTLGGRGRPRVGSRS